MTSRLAVVAVMLAVALPGVAEASDEGFLRPHSRAGHVQLRAVREVVRKLGQKVEVMELSAARYEAWEACIRGVPVSEHGDPDRQYGYAYDERDGSGPSFMPALAVDHKRRARRADYLFLHFARAPGCRSQALRPGGTAEAGSRPAGPASRPGGSLRGLERRAVHLRQAVRRLETVSKRFEAWESCVSMIPVTEHGDPDGGFGYRYGARGSTMLDFRPALSIDRSDVDDPDYMLLAFAGGDRPGRACRNEPGEAAAAPAATADRIEGLQQELDALAADVDDLEEPIAELDLFDECAYLIGVSEQGDSTFGYAFGRGGVQRRPALSFDIRGFDRAAYAFLAFPSEESPGVECNEDAGEDNGDD